MYFADVHSTFSFPLITTTTTIIISVMHTMIERDLDSILDLSLESDSDLDLERSTLDGFCAVPVAQMCDPWLQSAGASFQ